MAVNPYVNKVTFGGNTLLDLTSDTVSAGDLTIGITAHDRSGAPIVGTMPVPDDYVVEDGVANGWAYHKWASGVIEAWSYGSYTSPGSTGGSWVGYKNTPVTMADSDYYVFCQVNNWQHLKAYVGERTTTNFRVALGASGSATDTVFFYLYGHYAQ